MWRLALYFIVSVRGCLFLDGFGSFFVYIILEIYVSEDSHDWMQIRQGDIQNETILQIGLYGASPSSDTGFDVTFEDFMFKVE